MIATRALRAKPCRLRGELKAAVEELNATTGDPEVKEILVEGPRGTGKSRGALTHMVWNWMCEAPGSRWLIVRKTRESLTKTFCQTFEQEVVPEHYRDAVVGNALPESRSAYRHPNGSWAGLVGLDKPIKHKGLNIDGVILEEATELSWKQVEPFVGAIRKFTPRMPFQLFLALTNPGAPKSWLNQRANRGQMKRVRTRHEDNPKWYRKDPATGLYVRSPEGAAFLKSLQRYTGVEYQREVLGLWVGADGLVWGNFDENVHVIDQPKDIQRGLGIVEYRASMDWGSTHPGVLGIWGIDGDKRMTLVAEVYRTGQTPDWWARWAVDLAKEFHVSRIVCDPSRPEMIDLFNDWLQRAKLNRMAYGANNKKAASGAGDMGGLGLVRWGLEKDETGIPRIRFLRNALRGGPDPRLVEEDRPTCTVEEIPSYVHARDATGEVMLEATDKDCQDDGCDMTRYEATDNWEKAPIARRSEARPIIQGTDAAMFGTPETLEREALARANAEDVDGF